MPRLFFTTVGTSSLHKLPTEINRDATEEGYAYLTELFRTKHRENPKAVLAYSAEIKSLLIANVSRQDIVQLVCTDTEQGYLCGRILQNFLETEVACEVQLVRVEGLQVMDGDLFKKTGLHNYLQLLLDTHRYYQASHQIIMNLTGGFKSVIPYSTVAAMFLELPIFYVFEFSDQLIELPPLPISVDFTLFSDHHERFQLLAERGSVKSHSFYKGISAEQRTRLALVIEEKEEMVSLSALGALFWNYYKKNSSGS